MTEPMSKAERVPAFLWEGPQRAQVQESEGRRILTQSSPGPIQNSWKHCAIYVPGKVLQMRTF